MAEGKSEQLAYETQEKTAGNYVGEVLAEPQARELQHVNRWSDPIPQLKPRLIPM